MCNFKYSFVEQTTLFKGIDMKLSLFGRHDQIGNSFLDWGFHHADEIGPIQKARSRPRHVNIMKRESKDRKSEKLGEAAPRGKQTR